MNVAVRKTMTLAQFLAWEERQELRYEFDGMRPVAMTGGTIEHEIIGGNLRAILRNRLKGQPCRVLGPTIKIEVQGHIRYPDAVVSCTPTKRGERIAPQPVIVFEVMSESTSRTDRIDKLREYQATKSIQRYVLLEQDSIAAMVFSRQDLEWAATVLTEGEVLKMPEIGVEIPLADIYADVDMPPPPATEGDAPTAG